jgi:hypothetical protein
MALAGRRFGCGRGGISGAPSLCRGTTHARFGSEVERKSSNLVAHSPAERSTSYGGEGQGGPKFGGKSPLEELSETWKR